jgi:hypothetical protein
MVFQITSDPQAAAKALFTVGDGFEELTPAPAFDFRTYELDQPEAESKLALLIDGMTKVADKTGRFVYQRESCTAMKTRRLVFRGARVALGDSGVRRISWGRGRRAVGGQRRWRIRRWALKATLAFLTQDRPEIAMRTLADHASPRRPHHRHMHLPPLGMAPSHRHEWSL